MKADWRYDRIKQLKNTLGNLIIAVKTGTADDRLIDDATKVLNENRQAKLAADKALKAAELEQF